MNVTPMKTLVVPVLTSIVSLSVLIVSRFPSDVHPTTSTYCNKLNKKIESKNDDTSI